MVLYIVQDICQRVIFYPALGRAGIFHEGQVIFYQQVQDECLDLCMSQRLLFSKGLF